MSAHGGNTTNDSTEGESNEGGSTAKIEERPDGAREFKFLDLNDILFTHTIGIFGRRGSGYVIYTRIARTPGRRF